MRIMREMVGSNSSVSVSENRVVTNNGVARESRGREVISDTSYKGVTSPREALYQLALMKPVYGNSGFCQKNGNGNTSKDELVSAVRNRKDGMNVISRRNHLDGGVDGWLSVALQRKEKSKGLWHVRAKFIGWKERLDSLLKEVDGGLGQDFVALKW